MTRSRTLVALAVLPALLACSALGVCWLTFAAAPGHGCCEQAAATSLRAGPASCASVVVGTAVPSAHAPEAWAWRPPVVAPRAEARVARARVLATKAPPLVLRV